MKYVLGLGLEFRKYKKPCTIQIYSKDKFIDEFVIEKDQPLKNLVDLVKKLKLNDKNKFFIDYGTTLNFMTTPKKVLTWEFMMKKY